MSAKRNVKVNTPGEPPALAPEGAQRPPGKRAKKDDVTSLPANMAAPAGELPDQSSIDPAAIPYGQTRMSRQGVVCSSQEPPRKPRGG